MDPVGATEGRLPYVITHWS